MISRGALPACICANERGKIFFPEIPLFSIIVGLFSGNLNVFPNLKLYCFEKFYQSTCGRLVFIPIHPRLRTKADVGGYG